MYLSNGTRQQGYSRITGTAANEIVDTAVIDSLTQRVAFCAWITNDNNIGDVTKNRGLYWTIYLNGTIIAN